MKIRGIIVRSMLSDCLNMSIFFHELVDLIFDGQSKSLHVQSQTGPELVTNV